MDIKIPYDPDDLYTIRLIEKDRFMDDEGASMITQEDINNKFIEINVKSKDIGYS